MRQMEMEVWMNVEKVCGSYWGEGNVVRKIKTYLLVPLLSPPEKKG